MPALPSTPVSVTDAYRRLSDLLNVDGGVRLLEGTLQAQTAGVTVRFGDRHPPATTAGGTNLASGQSLGIGPVLSYEAAWSLDEIWLRRTTAGVAAELASLGVIG